MRPPPHLLQSHFWGEFKTRVQTKAVRINGAQFTLHRFFGPYRVGYAPRVDPKKIDWEKFVEEGRRQGCIFLKIEPNIAWNTGREGWRAELERWKKGFLAACPLLRVGERMFAYSTFLLNLKPSEEELLERMHPKTRYNIKVAQRHGVRVDVRTDKKALEIFLRLQKETARRQGFFVHGDDYFRSLTKTFVPKGMSILTATYQDEPLAAYLFLRYGQTLYYPYGGSSEEHKEVMAPYAIIWEAIRLGKKLGCHYLDLWNSLGPDAQEKHPWYGFHRFKKGFGGELLAFPGAFDLVFEPRVYSIFLAANKLRWFFLRFLRRLGIV